MFDHRIRSVKSVERGVKNILPREVEANFDLPQFVVHQAVWSTSHSKPEIVISP